MFIIPSQETKRFSQPNYGDTQGNLWGTFGVDLTKNSGRVKLTRCETVYSEVEDADMKLPVAFSWFDVPGTGDPTFIAYAGKVFIGDSDPIATTWVQDTITNSPTDTANYGDMTVFNGKLYATESAKLKRLSPGGSAWSDITTLTSGQMHQLCTYEGRLYFVDDNQVLSIDAATETVSTTTYTLDLSVLAAGGHISWIKAGSNRIWIGITKNNGTQGVIYEWDGVTENLPSKPYYIESQGSAGCAIWNDIPYVLDIEGRLLAFDGANFKEVARLPIMQYDAINTTYATATSTKICHFNGIKYINDAILILVNNESIGKGYGALENYPLGVYEYTKENGLTHKFSPSLTVFGTYTKDYGQIMGGNTGAIFDATTRQANANSLYASVMFGVNLQTSNSSVSINAINVDILNPVPVNDEEHVKQGYLITPFLETAKVTDVWQKTIIKYRKLLESADKIIVKYRTTKDIPVVLQNVTWDSTTQFTTSNNVPISLGDEVEVLNGNGGASLAHITNLVDNGSTTVVTLDEAVIAVTAGNKSDVRVQSWKKLPVIVQTQNQFSELVLPQANKDTELQLKVVMRWFDRDNELREVLVINKTDQETK